MTDRYNQPEHGTENWHEPLNENFDDIGTEVTEVVDEWGDLPDEAEVEQSSNGQWPRFFVLEDRVNVRVTSSATEIIGGQGSEERPIPDVTHLESLRTEDANIDRAQIDRVESSSYTTERTRTKRRWSHRGQVLHTFEGEPNDWSLNADEIETDDVYHGTQSVVIETTDDNRYFTWGLDVPRDFSNTAFSIAVKGDTVEYENSTGNWGSSATHSVLLLQLIDTNNELIRYQVRIRESDTEWTRKDFQLMDHNPNFDFTNVDTIGLQATTRDYQLFRFDSLRQITQPDKGLVAISSDDIWAGDYDLWNTFQEYDLPVAFCVNAGYARNDEDFPERLRPEELKEMHTEGAEMVNHGYLHYAPERLTSEGRSVEHEEWIEDVMRGKYWLDEWGMGDSSHIYVYPGGRYDSKSTNFLNRWHAQGWSTITNSFVSPVLQSSPFTNMRSNFDTERGAGTLNYAKEAIDIAEAHGGFAHIFCHANSTNESDWHEMAQYIDNADVQPIKLRDYYTMNNSAVPY